MYKIFDAHTHIYPDNLAPKAVGNLGAFYRYGVQCDGTFDGFLKNAREGGVDGFLLLTVVTNAHQVPVVNNFAADCMKRGREAGLTALSFCGIHQDMTDEEKEKELERCREMGMTGVKLHPDIQGIDLDDKRLFPLYEMLTEKNLPVCFHMGDERPGMNFSEPEKLIRLKEKFPDLKVIAAHFGGYKIWDRAEEIFAGREGIMFDCSSSLSYMTRERAKRIIERLGTENIMFGTDHPSLTAKGEVDNFLRIELTEKEREDILWNNAARFLGV